MLAGLCSPPILETTASYGVARTIADFRTRNASEISNVSHVELVVALAAARIDLGGDRVDALPVDIKRSQKFSRVEPKVWLNVLQGSSLDNELAFHGPVISPEADRLPRRVVAAAGVWKTDRHVCRLLVQDNRVNRIMVALPILR